MKEILVPVVVMLMTFGIPLGFLVVCWLGEKLGFRPESVDRDCRGCVFYTHSRKE